MDIRVDEPEEPDDRPPICPACGVTMGFALQGDGSSRVVCLECGFSDNDRPQVVVDEATET